MASTAAFAEVDYLRDIKPVLQERCYACHGALKQKAGLRLDTAARMLEGGREGKVVIPSNTGASELLRRIAHPSDDERMPPEGKPLTAIEINHIRDWIAAGAPVPESEQADEDPRDHWAYQRIERPPLPGGSGGHPIDAFLDAQQSAANIKPLPEAARPLLIRRLYLDLIGLPPTRDQLHDNRPWEKIVDELLANPHHGERWGRHWMDVWRYSDWYGLGDQLRYSQKHLWRWRDWIIDSLNQDKGYDRMILEMIAGDELAPEDPDVIRATGFLARNYYLFNRTTWLDSTIEHTSKAFLGLTLNCAKCHDHKYDPISMEDYYRMRAIFEPHQVRLDPVPGVTNLEQDGLPRVFDNHPDIPTHLHRRGDPKDPDTNRVIRPGVPDVFADFAPGIRPVELPPGAFAPATRDYVRRDHLRAAGKKIEAAQDALALAETKLAELRSSVPETKRPEATPAGAIITDAFDKPNPEVWEIIGTGWQYKEGALHQTRDTRERELVRSQRAHPRDFEVTCRYTTTGGSTYKSVTVWFDLADDHRNGHMVYTSAHGPDPKLQVAHRKDDKDAFPAPGRVSRAIKVGEVYTLRFAVRDHLINVWLNNEFQMAYQLPRRMPGGKIALSGFDATVAFDDFTLRPLSPDIQLTDAKKGEQPREENTREAAERAIRIARAQLEARQLEAEALKASLDADRARWAATGASASDALAKTAARLEADASAARAKVEMATHEDGDAKKLKAAEDKLAKAREQQKVVEKGEGEFKYTSLKVTRKALETPEHKESQYPSHYPGQSTGRRLALAQWMVSRDNPLTARVAVNHVWMRHFGVPLVESVFDFGRRAKRPQHAALLDYLAADFIESGWRFRHLHRLIVTSDAYRRSGSTAQADPATRAADPDNRFHWRMNARRMESQIIRDNLLFLAGALDPQLGGPPMDPKDPGLRRSLYFKHSRDQQDKFLDMFDDADHLQCYRRSESIVPQQALALANSKLSMDMAGRIAERLAKEAANDSEAFVEAAFESLLGRLPDDAEKSECRQFEEQLAQHLAGENAPSPEQRRRVWARLVHALLNHNDFVTIR